MKAVGGGKMEPVGPYKPRKDIGTQKTAAERQQQPEKERGSKEVAQSYAEKVKAERRAAAQARAAAKKGGSATTTAKAKPKDLSKQASQLLSTKKAEEKPATRTNRKWRTETGAGMTKSERASARGKEKTAKAQETKKSATEILAKMRKEYEEGGGKWSNAVAVKMRAKAKAAAQASGPQIINGMEHMVTTVNGLDRVEINNKLHHLGDQLMKLKLEQDQLIQMRNMIDRQNELSEMNDLFDEMFGG
jgi:hypothetical protein